MESIDLIVFTKDPEDGGMVQGSPELSLTLSFSNLEVQIMSASQNLNWDLIPLEMTLIAEGSGSHSTFRDTRNYK